MQTEITDDANVEAAIELLRSLCDDEEQEQRETGTALLAALDEDRPSYRKLFPSP
ncbi:MAG: hypothetical protein IT306_24220 [Chloroflexi bacterium]|nr:hypothetical protein [Chloroflexota bacterium]